MFSTYTGDLKPQKNEGITKVKWVSPKKLIKVRKIFMPTSKRSFSKENLH